MKINFLRASSINTYHDCQWKFFLEQVCGFESMAGKKATLGTISHHVLEILAKAKKTGHYKLNDKFTDVNYLARICWNHYANTDEGIKNGIVKDFAGADFKFVLDQVNAVMNSKYNPLLLDILDTEKQFEIEINRPGFEYKYENDFTSKEEEGFMKIRGTIDLVTKINDDTIEIIDYKTGERKDWVTGKPKEIEDFFSDMQLKVYDVATRAIYKDYKFRMFTIIFTRNGGPFTVTFDMSDYRQTLNEISKIYRNVLDNYDPVRIIDDPTRSDRWKCKRVCYFGRNVDDNGISLCEKYYKLYSPKTPKLSTLTLRTEAIEASKSSNSRRNDYSHAKIFKGKLC
jgi:hypothetical protein